MKKVIAVVATGGTIANTTAGRTSVEQVLEDIGTHFPADDPRDLATLVVSEVLRIGAENFTPEEWITVADAVERAARDDTIHGVVVTHGTFTVEETAFFVHLTVRTNKPIVIACSQRKHGTIGNDGDKNLVDAIRVAVCGEAAGMGVLVVLNEEIHSARDVTKTNQRPSGFRSGGPGILGSVEKDRVTFYRAPTRRHTQSSEFTVPTHGSLPRTDIVATYAGADGVAAEAFVDAGSRGLVVNGFAYNGRPHDLQIPALQAAAARGIPVVLANRGGDGRVPVDSEHGFIRADSLLAQKARVLLSLAIIHSTEQSTLQRMFNEY